MRGAAFRSRHISNRPGRFSLDIRPLAELVELHHSRKATERHDKIYALLGMAHDLNDAQLPVDYELPWSKLLQRFVKVITSETVQVETWDDKETAIVQGPGHLLGQVVTAKGEMGLTMLRIEWRSEVHELFELKSAWTLPFAATPILAGDVVCLLQGASRPTIIRPYKDYWAVVRISVTPTDKVEAAIKDIEWPVEIATHLLLVWDWDMYQKPLDLEDYYGSYRKRRGLECPDAGPDNFLDRAIRLQNLGVGLQEAEKYKDGYERISMMLHEIDKELEPLIGSESTGDEHTIGRDDEKLREAFHLLTKSMFPVLAIAAENGHLTVVKLLLDYGEVDPNLESEDGNNPLLGAVVDGRVDIVKLLLKSSRVDPNAPNLDGRSQFYGETPIWRAAYDGNKTIFQILIDSGRVVLGDQQTQGGTPLMYAAKRGHDEIVKLLLEICKVDPDAKGEAGATALSWTAESGHVSIVKMLLDTGRVDPDVKDNFRCTPLYEAASNGHCKVAELLLSTSQVDPDAKSKSGKAPLWVAADEGHEDVVELLLSTGKVDVNVSLRGREEEGRTPLWAAASGGHAAVVELLLNVPGVDRDLRGRDNKRWQRFGAGKQKLMSPLEMAKKEEHWEVVKLLEG